MNKKYIAEFSILFISLMFVSCKNEIVSIYEPSYTDATETADKEDISFDDHEQRKAYKIEWIQKNITVPLEKTVDVKIPQIIVDSPNEQIINYTISEMFLIYCDLDYPEVSVETEIYEYEDILSIYMCATASPGRIPIVKCINYDLKNDTILTIEYFLKTRGYNIQNVKEEIWNSPHISAVEGLFVNQFYINDINDKDEIIIVSDVVIHQNGSYSATGCIEYNLKEKSLTELTSGGLSDEFWQRHKYTIMSDNRVYPIYRNKYPYDQLGAEFDITDEVTNTLTHNMERYISLLNIEANIQYSFECEDKVSLEYDSMYICSDVNGISISTDKIDLSAYADTQSIQELIVSDKVLNAACKYIEITVPDVFKTIEFDVSGNISSIKLDIIQESRVVRDDMDQGQISKLYKNEIYNRYFNKIMLIYTPETNSTHIYICQIDTSEVDSDVEIIPYYQALEKLADKDYYTNSSTKNDNVIDIFTTCEIGYSNDFINNYYIPCYKFTVYDEYGNISIYDVAAVDYTTLK